MGGHCAGCCTLTLWNLCFQVKVGSWYRGGKRAKRDMQETKKNLYSEHFKISEKYGGRSVNLPRVFAERLEYSSNSLRG